VARRPQNSNHQQLLNVSSFHSRPHLFVSSFLSHQFVRRRVEWKSDPEIFGTVFSTLSGEYSPRLLQRCQYELLDNLVSSESVYIYIFNWDGCYAKSLKHFPHIYYLIQNNHRPVGTLAIILMRDMNIRVGRL
jgi:hypothetical protein